MFNLKQYMQIISLCVAISMLVHTLNPVFYQLMNNDWKLVSAEEAEEIFPLLVKYHCKDKKWDVFHSGEIKIDDHSEFLGLELERCTYQLWSAPDNYDGDKGPMKIVSWSVINSLDKESLSEQYQL